MITNEIQSVSAPLHQSKHWDQIDWNQCEKIVKKLQIRIVKAVQEKRWNKVKSLQRLITRGFSGKALAVKHVTSNKGKRTAGVDGELWLSPTICYKAISSLEQRGYQPSCLRRIYIPKANGQKRPLSIPTMKDRAMQALYLLGLDPVSETTADRCSYGFRKSRSTADAIEQIFSIYAGKHRASWIFEGDITKCFDTISHDWLLNNIPIENNILRKWLKAGYMERHIITPTEVGTPQGGIISPTLANMVLDGLEALISRVFGKKGTKLRKGSKVHLVRYADDFIISGNSKEILEMEVKPLVERFLSERGLSLNVEKSKITSIEEGADFLGQNIRKYKGKLIIKPASKSVQSCLKKVREIIRKNLSASHEELIERLNPVIRGWANYHRKICARKTFEKLDHEIFTLLWRWARRRHPQKGLKWIKDKYFKTHGARQWVFQCQSQKTRQIKQLVYASDIKIQRHIMLKNEANPYDPAWSDYFAERRKRIMVREITGKANILWQKQQGLCSECRMEINDVHKWHIINAPRELGGKGYDAKLVHMECKSA